MIDRAPKAIAAALSLGALAWAMGCSPSSQAGAAEQEEDGGFVKVVNVEVIPVAATRFTEAVRITGEVEAMHDVTLSAEEAGVVRRFYKEKGEVLRRGEPLAKIDDRVLRAQVEETAAQARLAAERYQRQRKLWEEEKIGTEMNYLEAKYQAELAAARLESLRARLDRTTIVAPITGIFDSRFVEAGEMVSPGTRVARLVAVDDLKVTGGVPERYAGRVTVGDSARIGFDLFPDRQFDGVIRYVGTAIDPDARTFPVEIVMENPGRVVKPQMIANLEIATQRLEGVIVVPQTAVVRTEDGYQVFVAVERGDAFVAESRPVRLGPSARDRTVIREGLSEGDRVIVRGQSMVDPGDRVRIVSPAE